MPSVRDLLFEKPYEFDFFAAVRALERLQPQKKAIGGEAAPADEIARFRPLLALSFPPSQIVGLEVASDERAMPLLTITFFGLYGISGVMPTHYTQMMLDLVRDVRGPERRSLRDWLDLFNHRLTSLFYRAWEKYRFTIPYERGDAFLREPDTFTLAIRSIMGFGSAGHQNRLQIRAPGLGGAAAEWHWAEEPAPSRALADPAMLAKIDDLALMRYAGFFAQRPRNVQNLESLLADYFQLPVVVESFRGQWLAIAESSQTQLGSFGTLGVDAVAGERVWDVQSRFRVRLGPLTLDQFTELLPDPEPVRARKSLYLAMQLARTYAGPELDFDLQLVLAAPEVPEVQLGRAGIREESQSSSIGPRLGWNLWLISDTPAAPVDDAVFESDWITQLL